MILLDLFCGAGGAAMGYHRAGFDRIIGVDHVMQKNYPFEFVLADAMTFPLEGFDLIHASPPCQEYTPLRARQNGKHYPDLVSPTRDMLAASGVPWIIENVPGAPLHHWTSLCGGMFGLRTYRHRRFESSFLMMQAPHPRHVIKTSTKKRRAALDAGLHISVTGDVGSYVGPPCMGIDWMTGNELSQAIPPAYTEYIGREFLRQRD